MKNGSELDLVHSRSVVVCQNFWCKGTNARKGNAMEIKISVDSNATERGADTYLMEQINNIITDLGGEPINAQCADEFINGKEVPGAYLEYVKTAPARRSRF